MAIMAAAPVATVASWENKESKADFLIQNISLEDLDKAVNIVHQSLLKLLGAYLLFCVSNNKQRE